jgi:hypothetical protein
MTTPAGCASFAKTAVHTCIAALPDLPLDEMLCLVMDDADRLARAVGAHVAHAAGETYEENEHSQLHARPAPLAIVLELRTELGDRLSRRLDAPLAPGSMRVLWLAPSQRHVLDVSIDPHALARLRARLEDQRLAHDLGMDDDEGDDVVAPGASEAHDVGGTWKDPMRYLPMPLPAGWALDGVDTLGVLHVIIDERLECDVCALEPPEGKLLFMVLRKLIGGRDVRDEEARAVLERLRNVRGGFKELEGQEPLFGDGRVFASRVVEGGAPGSG